MFLCELPAIQAGSVKHVGGIDHNYQHLDHVVTNLPFWETLQSLCPDPQQPQDRVKE